MRTTFIALSAISLLTLVGCKYPDTIQTHEHVKQDFGGDIEWHPYVKKDYQEFQDWAMGKNCPTCEETPSQQPGPGLASQSE